MNKKAKILALLLGFALLILFSSPCFAGRQRVAGTKGETSEISDIEAEITFGRELAARILGNYKVLNDDKISKYINLVGKGLALFSGRAEIEFRFAVLDTDEINAFAAPGGYVFITKGLLKKINNEAQLAAVLAHEIAHITLKHVVNELDIKGEDESAIGGLAAAIGGATGSFRVALEQTLDNAAEILFERGYKLEDETETDKSGLLMISVAGYNPDAMTDIIRNMEAYEPMDKEYDGEHPIPEVRTNELIKFMKANGLDKKKGSNVKERFYEYVSL